MTSEEKLIEQAHASVVLAELRELKNTLTGNFGMSSIPFVLVPMIDTLNREISEATDWLRDITKDYTNPFNVEQNVRT